MKPGKYLHYKGKYYWVFGIARHSETQEELVCYKHVSDNDGQLWVRPKSMFLEKVEVDGQKVPRFTYIGDK